LIVEDDPAIAKGLSLNLSIEGYATLVAEDGEAALERVREHEPDLILLDISLPKKNGLDVLSELRAGGDHTPVIVLSARQDEFDKVAALRLGADDYVTKPFALAELLARCTAVLRRATKGAGAPPVAPSSRNVVAFSDVTIDFDTRQVVREGGEVGLTKLEFDLLGYFVKNPAKVFTRERLLRDVWGALAGSPRTVDNFVAQLRAKLEHDPEHPRHLVTVRGSGYRFDP
jgi:DNA-binding response OmpR family regulator